MEFAFVYRFDYKYRYLPYYLYVGFKRPISSSALSFISRKLCCYHIEFCKTSELESVLRYKIPVVSYSEFRRIVKGYKVNRNIGFYPDLFSGQAPY